MKRSPLVPIFAATLFLSAFLIFSVQPMVSKMLLPTLGGSPSVWNTAMVFFQAMLLAGYAYAHFVARYLSLRLQAILHLALLCLFTFALPFALPANSMPPADSGQALWQLTTMLTCIGGPFFVLAASAPLFQHWFASSGQDDAENPYFLYAISNAGSMIALLGYPLLAEPLLKLSQQTGAWFFGYLLLIAMTFLCAWLVRNGKKPVPPLTANNGSAVDLQTRLIWIILSFIPSSLMLGVTTMITTDLASAPFLWIIPLTIYLATFIIAFARKPAIDVRVSRELSAMMITLSILMFMTSAFLTMKIPMVAAHLATFFFCSLLCHGELARFRPSASHLTEYFLLISLGGVLGGIFNALIAPAIFLTPVEYALSLSAVSFVIWAGSSTPTIKGKFNAFYDRYRERKIIGVDILTVTIGLGLCAAAYFIKIGFIQVFGAMAIFLFLIITGRNRASFAVVSLVALLLFHSTLWSTKRTLITMDRNYFGVLKVYAENDMHFFYHGTTIHGAEWQSRQWKRLPVTYYNPEGPTGDIFYNMDKRPGRQNIAALGLGVGSIACYKAPLRHFDFYEIDADVVKIAQNPDYFSYLSNCKSPYDIVLGDARLKISNAPDGSYDLIFIDTFSSDNIPVHIMTREAFETYLKKLSPDGLIAINISNRYLDLRGPIDAVAKNLGLTTLYKADDPGRRRGDVTDLYTPSFFAVLARNPERLAAFAEDKYWQPYQPEHPTRMWTDDYANILGALVFLQ